MTRLYHFKILINLNPVRNIIKAGNEHLDRKQFGTYMYKNNINVTTQYGTDKYYYLRYLTYVYSC